MAAQVLFERQIPLAEKRVKLYSFTTDKTHSFFSYENTEIFFELFWMY